MSLKPLLQKTNLRYLFLGGKGGVGKTVSASAIAVELAKHYNRVLIVSTDPAHSLSDCFDQDLSGGEPVLVENVQGNLYGLELEAKKGYEDFMAISNLGASNPLTKKTNEETFEHIEFDDETYEDEVIESPKKDSNNFAFNFEDALGLGADILGGESIPPGSDEAFAFGKLLEFIEGSDFDLVIFDTAPTGHTLRLLSLPDFLDSFIGRMLKFRMRFGNLFKSIKNIFGGAPGTDDNSIKMLEQLKKTITKARIELADDAKTEFIPVTIPTLMALYETERLVNVLNDYSIPVERIIINQLIPPSKNCPFCAKRYDIQEKTILTIKQYFDHYSLIEIPMVPQEIRGLNQLEILSHKLFN